MGWKDPKEVGAVNNTFVSLKDGQDIVGVIVGEPLTFKQVFVNGKSHLVEDDHPAGKFRFRCNLVTKEDDRYVAKVLEQGPALYKKIYNLGSEYELEKTAVKISREGEGYQTKYELMPLGPKSQPTEESLAEIARVELLNLDPKNDAKADESFDSKGPTAVGDMPDF